MSDLHDFASGLVDEVLTEMAENFFGSRKRLDDLIEGFANHSHDLRKTQEEVVRLGSGLLALIPESGHAALRELLGENGHAVPFVPRPSLMPLERMPRALTLGGRYAKVVLAQYGAYREAVDAYMNGVVSAHPDYPRRKVVSLHYHQLKAFADRINHTIDKMNQEMPASCVIRYAHGFSDPVMADKERITGAHCPYPGQNTETGFDQHYAYHSIDFDSYGLAYFSDLPTPKVIASDMKKLCSGLMRTEKAAIVETMAALKRLE